MNWMALMPLAKKLIDEYLDKGKIDKSTLRSSLAAAFELVRDADCGDLQKLGSDLKIIGTALEAIAINHAPRA